MLVSCVMPTYNRRKFLPRAIECYLQQDWTEKELIVVDDGSDRVEDVFRDVPGCRYFFGVEANLPAHRPKSTIGWKLNQACELAAGEVIVRWDDDDWNAPTRISDQMKRLIESGKDLTGYHSMLFWHADKNEASKYQGALYYALGSSLCFRKSFWMEKRFQDSSNGEDNAFVNEAKPDRLLCVDAEQLMVASIHEDNTSRRNGHLLWPEVSRAMIPEAFWKAVQV